MLKKNPTTKQSKSKAATKKASEAKRPGAVSSSTTKATRARAASPSDAAPTPKRFRIRLERHAGSSAAMLTVPFDAHKVFGTRARVPVRGTINGYPYRGSIFPMGNGQHYMVVRKELREVAGIRGGETISVTMGRDDEPRTVTPPADLARALKRDRAAQTAWDKLSYTHQREYAELLEGAKRPETRARRLEKTLSQLAAGKKELYDK